MESENAFNAVAIGCYFVFLTACSIGFYCQGYDHGAEYGEEKALINIKAEACHKGFGSYKLNEYGEPQFRWNK